MPGGGEPAGLAFWRLGWRCKGFEGLVRRVPVDNFVVQNVTSVTLKHCLDSRVLIFYRGSS